MASESVTYYLGMLTVMKTLPLIRGPWIPQRLGPSGKMLLCLLLVSYLRCKKQLNLGVSRNNLRTGRAVLMNPTPPPATTYLDNLAVQADIILLQRVPESKEHMYRRTMATILQILFSRSEGYSVVQETNAETTRPDFTTLKVFCRPGRILDLYEFLVVESKGANGLFEMTEPQFEDHLKNCSNESKNTYGMIQCGLRVRFYKHENFAFQSISPNLHLVDDARGVMDMVQYLKDHPMSFI